MRFTFGVLVGLALAAPARADPPVFPEPSRFELPKWLDHSSFLAGLAAMARFSLRDRRPGLAAVNIAGAAAVAFTLLVNLARGYPLLSIAATGAIAATLYALWARAGRPAGVEEVERHLDPDETPDERADRTDGPA